MPNRFTDDRRVNYRHDAWRDEQTQRAGASEFVDDLRDGIDTSLAEAGASLSAGQRQRIAIARSFLKQAPILLLDEPTTGLDSVAERQVMAALRRLMRGRTTLMVAHKLSTVQKADRIFVMKRGKLVEQGTHQELLAAGGWYSRTWAAQAREYPETRSRILAFHDARLGAASS